MEFLGEATAPTPEVSLLSGTRLSLVTGLRSGASYAKVMTLLPSFLPELENKPEETKLHKLDKTKAMLNAPYGPDFAGPFGTLLHSIPRDVLVSLIMGTVAYDMHNGKITPLAPAGPGVYVMGLKIQQRQGRFLHAGEYRTLISDLQRYIKVTTRMWNCLRVSGDDARFVADVQNQIGTWDKAEPRFIATETNRANAEMLVLSLTRRYHALAAQDPSRQVYSVQSPLYVGCSKHISNRWVEYDRLGNQTAYHSANKLMTLTMSLLWYRNLGAEVGKATVIRTWEAGQMKEAELLVAVVANAYSTQDGFNVVETGQTKDDGLANDAYKVSEQWEYVFSEMPHLADNLALSLDEIELAKKAEQVAQLERDLEAARTESEAESRRLQERVDDCILELEKQTPEIRAIATGIAKDRRLHQNASVVLRDIIKSAK